MAAASFAAQARADRRPRPRRLAVWRRTFLLSGLSSVLLMVLLMVMASPAWTAALAPVEVSARTPTGPASVDGTAATAAGGSPLAALAGVWQRRDAWLWVDERGTARLRWRTDWCEPGVSGPCDRLDDQGLALGAVAEMSLPSVVSTERATVRGQVTGTNTVGPLQVGPVSLTRLDADLVELRQGDQALLLCRPPRDPNSCTD